MLNKATDKNLNRSHKIYFLILLLALPACAYRPRIIAEKISPQQIVSIKKPVVLKKGEKLKYSISWIGISAGKMDLEIKDVETIGGRNFYRLYCDAGPSGIFSLFFNSRYILETYVDAESGLPLKSSRKKIRKAGIEEDIFFDWNKNIAEINDGKVIKKIALTKNSHDLLSFLYYYRIHGLEPEKKYNFDIIYGGKSWSIEMTTEGAYQLRLRGKECVDALFIKLSSALILEIMGNNELSAYVSTDLQRVPVFFSVKTKMGKADTTLIEQRQCELPELKRGVSQ